MFSVSLANILPETPAVVAESAAPTNQKFATLRQLLHSGDFSAQTLAANLTPDLQAALGENYAAFDKAIANFDFEVALALINTSTAGKTE